MINVFLSDFYTRLRSWHALKEKLTEADLQTICVEVDNFWQRCPITTHYLHPADIEDWPNPWELLKDNDYCHYGRALGMIYTLLHLGIKNIDLVDAIDYCDEHAVLVLVDDAKYALNYYPNSVLNIDLTEFKITRFIDIKPLTKKTGKE